MKIHTDGVGQLGSSAGAYNGSFYVHMTNGAVLCPEPLRTCGSTKVRGAGRGVAVHTGPETSQLGGRK